jgi:hypothetical protein
VEATEGVGAPEKTEEVAIENRKLEFDEREIVLRADFNELDEERCLWASLRFLLNGPRPPREGEWVYLLDPRGDGCMGQIDAINGWMARVRPDWESWAGGRPPPA